MCTASPPSQPPASSAYQPNIDILGSLSSPQPPPKSSTPVPALSQPQSTPTPPKDPFASLVSASPRHSPAPSSANPQPASLLDLGAPKPKAEEDEWNFASSLPETSSLPSTNRVQVLNSSLKVEFAARRHPQQQRQIHIVALFSNGTNQALNDLHFQVAVEKVLYLITRSQI